MKTKEQRNLIQDIFPPQINRPLRQVQGKPAIRRSKDSYMNFQTGFQCISISLIGLLIFMPLSPVFAEEITESSKEVSDIDIISQTTAVEDEAPILLETDSVEEESASTTKESSVNELVEESVENEMEEIVEERVVETGAEEIINSITESVIENSEAAENTDVIAESESETATSSAAINSEAVKSLQEENDDKAAITASTEEILTSNAADAFLIGDVSTSSSPEIVVEDASTTVQDMLDESVEITEAAIEEEVAATSTTEIGTEIAEAVEENSYAAENTDAIIEFKIETATPSTATNPAEQNLFAGKECIFLNNGNDFYCFKSNKESNASTSIENPGAIEKGKVSSIRDLDGDREISLYINGKSTQITNNNWDDLFPAQDISGSSIVWQSLVNERWQIMFYDQGVATTTQITDSDFNNMMPQIYGDVIVWQGWPRDNWEIFYAKKNNNGEWIVKQVTNNDYPDMFPKVMGNNIIWQALSSEGGSASGEKDGSWHIFTYDIKSGAVAKISSAGIKNENPKFMIVWEEKGDGTATITRTFGYDLFGGEVVELNNNEKPQEIPEPPLKNDAALSISTTTPNKLEDEESD